MYVWKSMKRTWKEKCIKIYRIHMEAIRIKGNVMGSGGGGGGGCYCCLSREKERR